MLISYFNPHEHNINNIVLGSGDWTSEFPPNAKDVVKANLPFRNVVCPQKTIKTTGFYSLDGSTWYHQFPVEEVVNKWIDGQDDSVCGVISFRIEIVPDQTTTIRELGFFVDDRLVVYRTIKEFVVGKVSNHDNFTYSFNYNLKCMFVTSATINALVAR